MQSIILAESVVANTAKSTYQKKYKCPYCDKRFVRAKLHIHIQNEHEDLIPEGYTALRVAFNTINHKTEGHCIMCGAVTDWNEDKGRYERLCNNPKCHEAYKKMVAERTKKKYGTERLQTDPEYAEYVQRKALAGRKMHGEYKFADGGVIEYFGSYEKKFLQFMDQIMHCKSEDILAPAPSIKYIYNGEQHLYIPDFYYIPYNLIIEIKDGGSNPNNHPHRTGEDELKLRCKEEAIIQLNEFSYVRVVNNDFSQVLSIMAVLKYNMAHRYKDPVVKVNESTLLETASIVDKNFKPKDRINLYSLKKVHITEAVIEKYKKQYPDLRHVRCKDTDTYKCDGYMWFDNENLVAQVGSCEYLDDGTKWIVSLDIMKDYKGHGLSKQILDFATKIMKCKYLSVDKNNKLAKMIYDQYGFKVYYEDDKMYYMTLEANPVKVNESTLLESVSNNYPKDLYNWMKANITYKSTGILLSPEEVEEYGYGDCHDQANYIHSKLSTKDISNGRLFVIEYNDLNSPAGKTHTAAYYKQNGKYYWIENAWYEQTGIHGPYNSIFDLKIAIVNVWVWGNYKNLYIGSVNRSKIKNGMNLNDYVNACLPENEKMIKPFIINEDNTNHIKNKVVESMSDTIGGALPLTPNPIPYESNKDNYYIIQHMENNAFAYSLTKDPVQYTMYSVDPESKGFYKVFKSDKSKINKKYSTFKIKDRQKAKELYDELAKIESSNSKTFFAGDTSNDYIYQRLTEGSKIISDDQIRYDTRFEEVKNFNEEVQDICESVRNFILGDPITRLEEQVSTLSNLVNINESSNYVSSDYDMITSIEDYDNKVLKAKTAEQMGLIILYPEFKYGTCNKNTIDKLKKKYADFNALSQEKRTLSNRTAYHIFGYDNDTLYSKLLNLYVSTTMKSGGGSEGYSYNTMRSITPPIEQYYKPGEKVGTVSSDTKVARESFTDDSSWRQVVSKLCLEANNTSDAKKKNDLKNEIINLGWNPEIPFNEEAITRVKNMRHKLHIFTEVDAEEYIRNIHTFNEATYNQLKDKIVPVFICLFKGKALHSRGIELYTGSEWSHAAISFDSSMKQMYTFNMNPKVTSNGISKGFTIESIEAYWKIDPSIKFKVHALFVTKEQKIMMEDAIKWYVTHQNETKYSFKTIINIALKRVSDFGSEYANKTEMVCSQFVYTILAIADFKTKVTKDASLVSPGDLDTSIDDRLYSMFIGGIGLYSSKKIDRMVRQIIPTLPLDKYNI
jgi:ribosomal protein S18 acetylase RimI-like enzyme|nr:MAG TPA: cysteine peptidase [Caudoviricetes sp.]